MTGIPYAQVEPDGSRVCPACGERFTEKYDANGESLTNHYGEHYVTAHGDDPRDKKESKS